MNVLFNTLLLSQVGSVAKFLSFLAVAFLFMYFPIYLFPHMKISNILDLLDLLGLVLFAALLSYTIVYHTKVLLYNFIILGILSIIITFLPVEYIWIYYEAGLPIIVLFSYLLLLSPPIYDLYMYYNNKQTPKTAAGQIPTQPQSAGSSRKRRK
uniref:Uncharacterized protein n=1 Tax=viral metagenome TaxID=1070528 RepID=A0A6C0K916_9ZZZZ